MTNQKLCLFNETVMSIEQIWNQRFLVVARLKLFGKKVIDIIY